MKYSANKQTNEFQTQTIRFIKKSTQGPGRFFVFILSFMMVLAAHNAIFGEKNINNKSVKQVINKAYNFPNLIDLPVKQEYQENTSDTFIDDLVISSYENQWWEIQNNENQNDSEAEQIKMNSELKGIMFSEHLFETFASQ